MFSIRNNKCKKTMLAIGMFAFSSLVYPLDEALITPLPDQIEEPILTTNIVSSSTLVRGDKKYENFLAFDGKWDTAWVEGVKGPGIGEWIQCHFNNWRFKKMDDVYRISIVNGYVKSEKTYYENNRVKKLRVDFSEGESRILDFNDGILDYQKFTFPPRKIKAKWAKFTILEVYPGTKYDDTCITEIFLEYKYF